jgi:hypothetical protein
MLETRRGRCFATSGGEPSRGEVGNLLIFMPPHRARWEHGAGRGPQPIQFVVLLASTAGLPPAPSGDAARASHLSPGSGELHRVPFHVRTLLKRTAIT